MEEKYYNYIYLDPTKPGNYIFHTENRTYSFAFEPFYVGKGTGKRYKQHLYKQTGKFMYSKMQSILGKNIKPIMLVFNKNSNNDFVCNYEKQLIKLIGRRDLGLGSLCNLTDGGDDGCNQVKSIETRLKLSNALKGRKLSEENKKNIGLANKGKISKITRDAHKEYMRLNGAVKYGRKVYKIDLEGNILEEYLTLKSAAKENNVTLNFVSEQCRYPNQKPRFVKFKFKYKE